MKIKINFNSKQTLGKLYNDFDLQNLKYLKCFLELILSNR